MLRIQSLGVSGRPSPARHASHPQGGAVKKRTNHHSHTAEECTWSQSHLTPWVAGGNPGQSDARGASKGIWIISLFLLLLFIFCFSYWKKLKRQNVWPLDDSMLISIMYFQTFFICSYDIIVSDGIKGFSVFLCYSITVLRYRKINIRGPLTGKQAISLSSVLSRHFSFVLILLWSTRWPVTDGRGRRQRGACAFTSDTDAV